MANMANLFHRSKKLEISSVTEDKNCAMIILHDEDHTLGNSLRYMIMKNPAVKFCGYSMPHPNERKVILQIQTYSKKECEISQECDNSGKESSDTSEDEGDFSEKKCDSSPKKRDKSEKESETSEKECDSSQKECDNSEKKSDTSKSKKSKRKVVYQTAIECFEKGLRDLIDVSEHIKSTFEKKCEEYENLKTMELEA